MDKRSNKKIESRSETGESQVETDRRFAMIEKPIDVQITIHINNLILTYGTNIIGEFKDYLYYPDLFVGGFQIKQLCNHYGDDKIKNWFGVIYGWDFKKAE